MLRQQESCIASNTTTGDVSGYYIDSEDASTYQYNVKSITVPSLGLSGSTVVGFYATNGYLWVLTQDSKGQYTAHEWSVGESSWISNDISSDVDTEAGDQQFVLSEAHGLDGKLRLEGLVNKTTSSAFTYNYEDIILTPAKSGGSIGAAVEPDGIIPVGEAIE